mmetsp:Transcript_6368/g.8969  ORF Transcript_6368/g.8969 Transcript_6368/m.8969 type:complete len:555 (+) Transcript_6368:27-1691(+)
MKYRSTRGGVAGVSFIDAVMMGLAPDRGLLVPETIPKVSAETIASWKSLSFSELAFEIISLYVSREEISAEKLREMTRLAYETFRTAPDATPVVDLSSKSKTENSVEPNVYLLELFHGPTYAFKDVALQFLGRLFEFILEQKKEKKTLTILGATSGDTGSSAIYGVRGRQGVECFVLYPENRTSKIQEAQMATVPDANIHAVAVAGAEFDDCQKIVKYLFADEQFRAKHSLGAVNSINWARIVAQITYYFYAAFQVDKLREKQNNNQHQTPEERKTVLQPQTALDALWFSVPTGNFGDILAGWYAKQMGCPCGGLIVATNQNDILCRFFETGSYSRPVQGATPTLAPSMDICVSSNFERFVFHCAQDNAHQCKQLMADFENTGSFLAPDDLFQIAKSHAVADSVNESRLLATIKHWFQNTDYVLDPHTAIGVASGLTKRPSTRTPLVCLACAHHAKFPEAVAKAIGKNTLENNVPNEKPLTDLLTLPKRNAVVHNSISAVADYIHKTMAERHGGATSHENADPVNEPPAKRAKTETENGADQPSSAEAPKVTEA